MYSSDETRARARAQYFGPEMHAAIREAIDLIEAEIRSARAMSASSVTALLLAIHEPLKAICDRVGAQEGGGPEG